MSGFSKTCAVKETMLKVFSAITNGIFVIRGITKMLQLMIMKGPTHS